MCTLCNHFCFAFFIGFGSTANEPIMEHGVHYDCGCVLNVNGDLARFSGKAVADAIAVPAVYVAYFSTYGAMVRFSLIEINTSYCFAL